MEIKETNFESINKDQLLLNKYTQKLASLQHTVHSLRQKNSELNNSLRNKNLEKNSLMNNRKTKEIISFLKNGENKRIKTENEIISNQLELKNNLVKDFQYTNKEKEIQRERLIDLDEKRKKFIEEINTLKSNFHSAVKEREFYENEIAITKNENKELSNILENKKLEEVHLKQLYKIHFK